MKKTLIIIVLSFGLAITPTQRSHAIVWVVIQEAIKQAILAIDAQIQQLQNKTIGLQNAQKVIENTLAKLKLKEISEWTEKKRKLYDDYFQELWKVKNAISKYKKIKEIMQRQAQIAGEYKRAFGLFKKDKHFSQKETDYMFKIYTGIVNESLKNTEQIALVINAFATQMSDGQRVEIINRAARNIEENLIDLIEFNNQNVLLSIQRSKSNTEMQAVKQLYGLD